MYITYYLRFIAVLPANTVPAAMILIHGSYLLGLLASIVVQRVKKMIYLLDCALEGLANEPPPQTNTP